MKTYILRDPQAVEPQMRRVPRSGAGADGVIPNPKLKLLDQVRQVMRTSG